MANLVFSSLLDPAIAHCINQNELVPSELFSKHQTPHKYKYGEIRIWLNVPLNDISMESVRVEEFEESKDEDCG